MTYKIGDPVVTINAVFNRHVQNEGFRVANFDTSNYAKLKGIVNYRRAMEAEERKKLGLPSAYEKKPLQLDKVTERDPLFAAIKSRHDWRSAVGDSLYYSGVSVKPGITQEEIDKAIFVPDFNGITLAPERFEFTGDSITLHPSRLIDTWTAIANRSHIFNEDLKGVSVYGATSLDGGSVVLGKRAGASLGIGQYMTIPAGTLLVGEDDKGGIEIDPFKIMRIELKDELGLDISKAPGCYQISGIIGVAREEMPCNLYKIVFDVSTGINAAGINYAWNTNAIKEHSEFKFIKNIGDLNYCLSKNADRRRDPKTPPSGLLASGAAVMLVFSALQTGEAEFLNLLDSLGDADGRIYTVDEGYRKS